MAKTLHSRHNQIFLAMLRSLRESQHLRQTDLADLLGRSQATVSNVERGERRLDLIELRDWLDALEVDFIEFLRLVDEELRRLGATRIGAHPRRRGSRQQAEAAMSQMLLAVAHARK